MCTSAKQGGRTPKGGGYGIAQVEISIEKDCLGHDWLSSEDTFHFK